MKSVKKERGGFKWAVFAPYEYAHTFAVIYARLFNDDLIEIKVFKDEAKAREWLGI